VEETAPSPKLAKGAPEDLQELIASDKVDVKEQNQPCFRRKRTWIAAVALVECIAAGVGGIAASSGNDSSSSGASMLPTSAPTLLPTNTVSPRYQAIQDVLDGTISDKELQDTKNSPQQLALAWIANHDTMLSSPDDTETLIA
jgi:hypothetical protein